MQACQLVPFAGNRTWRESLCLQRDFVIRCNKTEILTEILTHLAYSANAKTLSNDTVTVLKACGNCDYLFILLLTHLIPNRNLHPYQLDKSISHLMVVNFKF